MAANLGKLAGQTLFITGASRGIGKAIALKAAKDGANIVIVAKTTEAHPSLPGTIFTAAKEIESAGGRCRPFKADIRHEDEVKAAVEAAVKSFGGIDILVNNASAISLTGTLETPMKRYDLMMGINGRGTYLCSQACLPFLKKSSNGHILNLSPPLNLNPRWFKNHTAYTTAKYNMSLCVLGMAEEFREDGIAVNALWPRTAIYTAAMKMLGGGEAVEAQCRNTDIIADAAYVILTQDSRDSKATGNFYIDEQVLKSAGETDFDKYACVPGNELIIDFFLDEASEQQPLRAAGGTGGPNQSQAGAASSDSGSSSIDQTFSSLKKIINADLVKSVGGTFQFNIDATGATLPDVWLLDLKKGAGDVKQMKENCSSSEGVDCTMSMNEENFIKLFQGKLNPTTAFMAGKLKIQGKLPIAMKLEKVLKDFHKHPSSKL